MEIGCSLKDIDPVDMVRSHALEEVDTAEANREELGDNAPVEPSVIVADPY